MQEKPSHRLTGLLLESRESTRDVSELCSTDLLHEVEVHLPRFWRSFTYSTEAPLRQEDLADLPPPYRYPMVIRARKTRAIVLSVDDAVVDHFLATAAVRAAVGTLHPVQIRVDDFVKSILETRSAYQVVFAHAKSPASGRSLRSISFYGEDVTSAPLFRNQARSLTFLTCGMRSLAKGNEIVRVSTDGVVSAEGDRPKAVGLLEEVLAYLRSRNMTT